MYGLTTICKDHDAELDECNEEIQHKILRKLNTFTPKHDNNNCQYIRSGSYDSKICANCQSKICAECFAVNVVRMGMDNKMEIRYHCKQCEYSRRYNELFTVIKFMYDSILQTDICEVNIIRLITDYAKYYKFECYKEVGDKCDWSIQIGGGYDVDSDVHCKIVGVLCRDCVKVKRHQDTTKRCKIYHEYDGKENIECMECDKLICNRCVSVCAESCKSGLIRDSWGKVCYECDMVKPVKELFSSSEDEGEDINSSTEFVDNKQLKVLNDHEEMTMID